MRASRIRTILALICLLFLAFIVFAPLAQAGPVTRCGSWASGTDWGGTETVTAARPRQYVDEAGYWRVCPAWVPDGGDPRMPEPKPEVYCAGRDTFEVWEVDDLQCSSVPPGVTSSTTTMLPRTKAGRVALIRAEWGPTRGLLVMRCKLQADGSAAWVREGATCEYR